MTISVHAITIIILAIIIIVYNYIVSVNYGTYLYINENGIKSTFEVFKFLYYTITECDSIMLMEDNILKNESIFFVYKCDNRRVVYLHAGIVRLGDVCFKFSVLDWMRYSIWYKHELKRLDTIYLAQQQERGRELNRLKYERKIKKYNDSHEFTNSN